MKWSDIRKQYPNKFILLGDLVEEKISEHQNQILEGTVLHVSDDAKEIREAYQQCQQQGRQVIYALPCTPQDFIVEDVPFMGLIK